MTRSTRAALTLRQEMQLVASDEIADFIEFEADEDFEWPSYVFGDFDDIYDDEPYDIWDEDEYPEDEFDFDFGDF